MRACVRAHVQLHLQVHSMCDKECFKGPRCYKNAQFLQRWGGAAVNMVQGQQPAPQHLKNQRTHHRRQEKENRDATIDHLHWEHTNIVQDLMVHQLHSGSEEGAPEGHQHR